jgi:hypothetical protein
MLPVLFVACSIFGRLPDVADDQEFVRNLRQLLGTGFPRRQSFEHSSADPSSLVEQAGD